jgi:D-tyrosyl-tRNA(Tyr) deacylase
MKAVIQRVKKASVTIDGILKSSIGPGLLIFLGIETEDSIEEMQWLCTKLVNLRIFNDAEAQMNLSIKDVKAEALVVSQFTLLASTKKGNRPSYIKAARPEIALPIYEKFIRVLEQHLEKPIASGEFGADMQVELINDGPVTLLLDTKNKE